MRQKDGVMMIITTFTAFIWNGFRKGILLQTCATSPRWKNLASQGFVDSIPISIWHLLFCALYLPLISFFEIHVCLLSWKTFWIYFESFLHASTLKKSLVILRVGLGFRTFYKNRCVTFTNSHAIFPFFSFRTLVFGLSVFTAYIRLTLSSRKVLFYLIILYSILFCYFYSIQVFLWRINNNHVEFGFAPHKLFLFIDEKLGLSIPCRRRFQQRRQSPLLLSPPLVSPPLPNYPILCPDSLAIQQWSAYVEIRAETYRWRSRGSGHWDPPQVSGLFFTREASFSILSIDN